MTYLKNNKINSSLSNRKRGRNSIINFKNFTSKPFSKIRSKFTPSEPGNRLTQDLRKSSNRNYLGKMKLATNTMIKLRKSKNSEE